MQVYTASYDDVDASAIALAHPSMYPVSARLRVFDGFRGEAADAALLRSALSSVGG